jgi:hypothetical protein
MLAPNHLALCPILAFGSLVLLGLYQLRTHCDPAG